MNELLEAAKAVIDLYDYTGPLDECEAINRLIAAVERAEKQEVVGFEDWWKENGIEWEWTLTEIDAERFWTAAQQAERERIRQIIAYQFGDLVSDLSEVMEMIDATTE